MPDVLDTNRTCTGAASALFASGFRTIFRYYSEFTKQPQKRLTPAEALALGRAGLRVGVVYQDGGNGPDGFTQSKGLQAGRYAYHYAQGVIHQAPATTIYFSVDFDAQKTDLKNNVQPFFRGVVDGFKAESGGVPDYAVGVYGSGFACTTLLDAGLASFAWVSQSMGFSETKDFLKGNRWHLRQNMPSIVCGLDVDTDERNPAQPSIGDFAPDLNALDDHVETASDTRRVVIARDGLTLRAGPGREFPRLSTLAFGTPVFVLSEKDDWAQVDLQGDGAADGYCFSSYLRTATT